MTVLSEEKTSGALTKWLGYLSQGIVMTKQIEVFSVQSFHMHTSVHSYTHSMD